MVIKESTNMDLLQVWARSGYYDTATMIDSIMYNNTVIPWEAKFLYQEQFNIEDLVTLDLFMYEEETAKSSPAIFSGTYQLNKDVLRFPVFLPSWIASFTGAEIEAILYHEAGHCLMSVHRKLNPILREVLADTWAAQYVGGRILAEALEKTVTLLGNDFLTKARILLLRAL